MPGMLLFLFPANNGLQVLVLIWHILWIVDFVFQIMLSGGNTHSQRQKL